MGLTEKDKLRKLLKAEELRKKNYTEVKQPRKLEDSPPEPPELFVDTINLMGKVQVFKNEIRFKKVQR